MIRQLTKFFFIASATCMLSACATQTYLKASHDIDQTHQTIQTKLAQANTPVTPVKVRPGYYVDTTPVSLKKKPSYLSQRISLRANRMPFSLLANRLMQNTNVTVAFDSTVNLQQPISLNYTGTVEGALKAIADKTNYRYVVKGNELDWSAFETRTFNISFMPGASTYLVGRSQGDHEDASNGDIGNTVGGFNDNQYSNLQGHLSVWNDLRRTLNELKSKAGRVIVSESTTMATVSDHPANIRAMAKYIAQLNKNLSQEVGIKVRVLDVKLDDQYNSGINWNLVISTLNTKFKLLGNLANAANPETSSIIANNASSALASFQIGPDANNAIIQALSEQGKVRVVTQPQVVTMNNQIASIRITQNTGYIQSVNSSYTDNYVTTSITPGVVTDGFTLYALPKIQGNKVFMQLSSTMSNLLALQKESTQPPNSSGSTSTGSTHQQQYNAIELPTISKKAFNQRSVIQSGNTLVIAGYKQMRDQAKTNSILGVEPLGGKGAKRETVETLVLITPIIMRGK